MNAESEAEPSREELIALVAALRAHIAELERRLGLNSSNSGKPPSSDGLKKPSRVSSLRERSGKKPGGQKGHKGETLRQVTDPNEVVNHYPPACSMCGVGLDPKTSVGHSARQVFDLPQPQPLVVTEHRAHDCECTACGAKTRALFPDGVNAPVQYGARITAFVIYLLHYQLLPENRLATLMVDLFGVKVATATIARMSRACAERLHGFVETVRDLVAGAPVKHMDETGFRIVGKTQWLHVASTAFLTFYRVCAKRGSLLANVVGIVVHDHWKPYYTIEGVLHALCNAHHLRELKALVEIEKEEWARKMQRLLRRACHITNRARERDVPLRPRLIECFERRYDAILGWPSMRPSCRWCAPLAKHKEDTLRFLRDPTVPFTNNQAERDGRMMKLRQKISGGFRSLQGAMDFALIRSFVSTARKQDWNIIDALSRDPSNLAKSLRLA